MGVSKVFRKRVAPDAVWRWRLAGITLLLVVSACGGRTAPDLRAVYALQSINPDQPPVILIHGALGSRLVRGSGDDPHGNRHPFRVGTEYWPSNLSRIAFSSYTDLALPIDPRNLLPVANQHLEVAGIAQGAAGRDFYGRIIRTLESVGGYSRAEPGEPRQPGGAVRAPNYYVFAYDWRQDNVQSARQLDAFIEQIQRDHNNPNLKVDVIAHSMGGLIIRYYARFGTRDVLDSNDFPMEDARGQRIRRAILLGTPNLGSAGAVRTLVRGYKVVWEPYRRRSLLLSQAPIRCCLMPLTTGC